MHPQYLRVKNWDEFQHYKDRRPPWIKLHVALTDDYGFSALSDEEKYHLVGIWLLAARTDNKIPNDPLWVAEKIAAKSPVRLATFIEAGFLAPWKKASGARAKWPSRHISKELRVAVLERDLHQCRRCSSTQSLEIDHIIPVSRGGRSESDNLQVLCRSCNRAKRAQHTAEQVATQPSGSVLPRREETETEGRDRVRGQVQQSLRAVDGEGSTEQPPVDNSDSKVVAL